MPETVITCNYSF